jgi:hypothetical protein
MRKYEILIEAITDGILKISFYHRLTTDESQIDDQ